MTESSDQRTRTRTRTITLYTTLYSYIKALKYRERNKNRVPILMVLTDKMYPNNCNLENHLRMPIFFITSGEGVQEIFS